MNSVYHSKCITRELTQSIAQHQSFDCFCKKPPGAKKNWRKACTFRLNENVTDAADKIGDSDMKSVLPKGDMTANNAGYHRSCLNDYYMKADATDRDLSEGYATKVIKEYAFNELIDYVEAHRGSGTILSMADLTRMYNKHLIYLGLNDTFGHTTRLRHELICRIPDITDIQISTRRWQIVYQEELRNAVEDLKKKSNNKKSVIKVIPQAVNKPKHKTLEKRPVFSGSFISNSEEFSTSEETWSPASKTSSNIVTSIAQIILHNYVGKSSKKEDGVARHIQERETLSPLVLSMKVHMITGIESLVNTLAERGLSISYDRLRRLSKDLAS